MSQEESLPRESSPPAPIPRVAWQYLVLTGVTATWMRALAASQRVERSVDEYQYAASAAFARHSGESLAATSQIVRPHSALYLLAEDPMALVDTLTSLAVGVTAILLGWIALRATRRARPAVCVALTYVLGSLPCEGLSSNAEPWVAIWLAGWLVLRSRPPQEANRFRDDLAAGVCLGLAAITKEQALVFVVLEPLLALALPQRSGRVRRVATAALGAMLPAAVYAGWYVSTGWLGEFLHLAIGWGAALGEPLTTSRRGWAALPAGLAPLLAGPVGVLGVVGLCRSLRRDDAATVAAALGLAVGVVAASLGLRWFTHYLWLPLPFLAFLAGASLDRALTDLRPPRRRWAVVTLAVAALAAALQVRTLVREPSRLNGYGVRTDEPYAYLLDLALDRWLPGDAPVLVWGWRPEVYYLTGRPPATRYRVNFLLDAPPASLLSDLETYRPGAVILPGPHDLAYDAPTAPYELDKHPELLSWIRSRLKDERVVAGYRVLLLRR
jgi:MFS family permease